MDKTNKKRYRYYVAIGYPESMKENWIEKLQETGLEIAISPIHDKDINPTGETKKAHYHILICYSNPIPYNSVGNWLKEIGIDHYMNISSVKGMFRYLIHKDNPEKYQYDYNDIQLLNGFDPKNYINISSGEIYQYIGILLQFIEDNDITEMKDFIYKIYGLNDPELFDIAKANAYMLGQVIASKRYIKEKEIRKNERLR